MSAKSHLTGSIVAGFPSPAEQYAEPQLDLNKLLVKRPAATYFMKVEGNSCSERGIFDGDTLIVDRSLMPAAGDIIIASVEGDFTIKEFVPGRRLDYFGLVTAVIHQFNHKTRK